MSEEKSPNRELLQTVREVNKALEALPVHVHQAAVQVLIVLGNNRLSCAQQEQRENQQKAEMESIFEASRPRLVTQ